MITQVIQSYNKTTIIRRYKTNIVKDSSTRHFTLVRDNIPQIEGCDKDNLSNHSVVNLLKKASTMEDEKSSIKLNIQEQYIKFKRVAKENSFQVVGNFVLEM